MPFPVPTEDQIQQALGLPVAPKHVRTGGFKAVYRMQNAAGEPEALKAVFIPAVVSDEDIVRLCSLDEKFSNMLTSYIQTTLELWEHDNQSTDLCERNNVVVTHDPTIEAQSYQVQVIDAVETYNTRIIDEADPKIRKLFEERIGRLRQMDKLFEERIG